MTPHRPTLLHRFEDILRHTFLIALCLVMLFPLAWTI